MTIDAWNVMWPCIKQMSPETLPHRDQSESHSNHWFEFDAPNPPCEDYDYTCKFLRVYFFRSLLLPFLNPCSLLAWHGFRCVTFLISTKTHSQQAFCESSNFNGHEESNDIHRTAFFHLLLPLLCSHSHPSHPLILSSSVPLYTNNLISTSHTLLLIPGEANTIPAKTYLI